MKRSGLRRTRTRPLSTGRAYYWVLGRDGHRTVLAGPKASIQEANDLGYRMGCYFDVLELPTVDRSRAAQIIKARRVENGQPVGEAMERLRHEDA